MRRIFSMGLSVLLALLLTGCAPDALSARNYQTADLFHSDGCYLFCPPDASDEAFTEAAGASREALRENFNQLRMAEPHYDESLIFRFEGLPCVYSEKDGKVMLTVLEDRCTAEQLQTATDALFSGLSAGLDQTITRENISSFTDLALELPAGGSLRLLFSTNDSDQKENWSFVSLWILP